MTTAIVAGCIATRYQYGGGAWVRRSWAEGLRRLGFNVLFLEHLLPDRCVDAQGAPSSLEGCVNLAYFDEVMAEFGMSDSAVLVYGEGEYCRGMTYEDVLARAEDAALLVNISGNLQLDDVKRRAGVSVYLDVDPGWAQQYAKDGDMGVRMQGHDQYFTIGENIGRAFCPIETGDVRWGVTRQPVVLDEWPQADMPADPLHVTTIATLKGPGPFPRSPIAGRMHGLKGDEFREFQSLPSLAPQTFEVALRRTKHWDEQVEPLLDNGWAVRDANEVSSHPTAFRSYVIGSGAEFSTARGVYVHTHSGWFSDRTARYLATGRPVLVQDTGFSRNLPSGEGLVGFTTLDEAVDGARRIAADYGHHAESARRIAEEHFDSDRVLARFIDDVGVSP